MQGQVIRTLEICISKNKTSQKSKKKLWFSLEDTASDYEVLLPIPNAFAVETEEYYSTRYKVNDVNTH